RPPSASASFSLSLHDALPIFSVFFRYVPPEALFWAVALIALAFYQPAAQNHFTLCPLSNLGFDFCPGCGLGKSIAWLFKGEILRSEEHTSELQSRENLVCRLL